VGRQEFRSGAVALRYQPIDQALEQVEADGLLPEDDPDDGKPTLSGPDPNEPADEALPGSATG
jgi:hypothetical protein